MDEESDALKKYNKIYLSIIMRYKDYIEEHEGLYVTELPRLVTPEDSAVEAVASTIRNSLPAYAYERDFLEAARLAQLYVKEKISSVSIPIRFWQRPAETLANSAGDPFDKAVLLCSILIALGGVPTKIIIAASDEKRDFLVYSEYRGELVVVDMEKGVSSAHSKEDLLSRLKIGIDPGMSAYEFNDKMYSNIL